MYWIGLAGEAVTDPQRIASQIQSDFCGREWFCERDANSDGCNKLCGFRRFAGQFGVIN